jgi:hypothetical protein
MKFIRSLLNQKDWSGLPAQQVDFLKVVDEEQPDDPDKPSILDSMSTKQASNCIQALLACPAKPKPQPTVPQSLPQGATQTSELPTQPTPTTPNVPPCREGYFYIEDPTEPDPLKRGKFFNVSHGKEGTRWEGYAFLKVQASDYFYPIKDANRREKIFAKIMEDPIQAMNNYGLKLGRCGVCNRTLTDRHSILRGIGPICAARLGPTPDQESLLRRLGFVKEDN